MNSPSNAASNDVLWALSDHQGSVRDMVDSAGKVRLHREFDAFGNVIEQTHYNASGSTVTSGQTGYLDEAFAYTGRWFDKATGLQNNLNWWYNAKTGRWLSEYPIGFAAGDANLYRYVGNAPTRHVDPKGLQHGGTIAPRPWNPWRWIWTGDGWASDGDLAKAQEGCADAFKWHLNRNKHNSPNMACEKQPACETCFTTLQTLQNTFPRTGIMRQLSTTRQVS